MPCLKSGLRLAASLLAVAALNVNADAVTDWNVKAGELVVEAKLGTPPAIRVMALVQTAVHDAVASAARSGASVDAAVAAASHATLSKLTPAVQASLERAYAAALAPIAEGPAKAAGIAAGETAAAALLASRADDRSTVVDAYRPHTTAAAYVPTVAPAALAWPQRKPWLMTNAAQFRPAPPPSLASATWASHYNEVKALGGKTSGRRTSEQTEVARFWEYSLPPIYYGVVHSVAAMPGRDAMQNARLFAAVAQAMDDAMIAVFDAKYVYHYWRPATAIRNGDIDGNEATERDASWSPFIDAPLHPEYPSAHSILAGAVGAVLKAQIGGARTPMLITTSPSAKGTARRWRSVDEFVQEIADARVFAGIHYRFSTEAGVAMGKRIGALAAEKFLQPVH
jgi:hypothetical protein